jgi:hypothetical protein
VSNLYVTPSGDHARIYVPIRESFGYAPAMDNRREYTKAGLMTISYDLLIEKLGQPVDRVLESRY